MATDHVMEQQETKPPSPKLGKSGEKHIPSKTKKARRPWIEAASLGFVALTLFLIGIGKPRTTYFDEGYYVPSAQAMLGGSLKADPGEPPLGKMLVAVGIKVAGDNPLGWRLPSAICGALTLVAVYLWAYLLLGDSRVAFLAGGLTLFNNFLFVMSRLAMMDVFLVFFLFWGVVSYTAALKLELSRAGRRGLICVSGVLVGLAGACKWNAVDSWAALVVLSLVLPLLSRYLSVRPGSLFSRFAENLRQIGVPSLLGGLIVLPALSYAFVYWVLFHCIHLPFGLHEFASANYAMWKFHVADSGNIALGSAWYRWPFMASPLRIGSYLLGNPVVMWAGAAAILFCLWRAWKRLEVSEGLVALLYAANLLQWAVTPSRASMYYYYYPAAMFLGVALAISLHRLPQKVFGIRIVPAVLLATALVFIWCYPRMAHLDSPWDCIFGCWI